MAGCDAQVCPQRIAAGPPLDIKPAPPKPKAASTKAKFATAEKTAKPSADQPSKQPDKVEEKSTSPSTTKPEARPAQTGDTSEAVVKKAKAKISASIDDPESTEFDDMKRALRKNTFGQPIDTICGHVKGKKKSGEAIGESPFWYLVKENEAYIVDRGPDSMAAIVYRAQCTSESSR